MINLLPPATKQNIMYARRNRVLIHWTYAMIIGLVGIFGVAAAGHVYIDSSSETYAKTVAQEKASLAAQKVDETTKRVADIGNSTKLVTQVLSREVKFSKLLQGIGAAMPSGASLQNLSIGTLEGAIDLQIAAADYQTATQAQLNLQDPANKIFDKADILNVSCLPTGEDKATEYPCQVSIRALFSKDSPFLISASGAKP